MFNAYQQGFPSDHGDGRVPWLGPGLNERFWGALIEWPLFFFSCSLSGPVGGEGPADKTEITLIREDGKKYLDCFILLVHLKLLCVILLLCIPMYSSPDII